VRWSFIRSSASPAVTARRATRPQPELPL
jgi:hypothetical protein